MPWYLGVMLTVFIPLIVVNAYLVWKLAKAGSEQFDIPGRRLVYGLSVGLMILQFLPIAASLTYWISGRVGMQAFSGENRLIDILLVYPFWTTLIITIQTALLLLAWDIARIVATKLLRRPRQSWDAWNKRVTFGGTVVVVVYSIVTVVLQTTSPVIRRHDIPLPSRFSGLDGVRILHLSDVQGDGRTDREEVESFVRIANELKPDLVMNSGDIVTSGDAYIETTSAALGGLEARFGRFAAVGDHDIFSGNKQKVLASMRASNHTMLEDTSIVIHANNTAIALTFVTYTYPQKPEPGELDTLLTQSDSLYRILLVHQPAMPLVSMAAEKKVNLLLAGHTHGGGVAFGIPWLGKLAPASFETRYVSGLYRVEDMFVYVTNGLGFTLAPIRFNAPIEITLLTLRAGGIP